MSCGFAVNADRLAGVEPFSKHKAATNDLFDIAIRLRAETNEYFVLIHHPEVIGDNYDENMESLNRLADAGNHLAILARSEP